MLNHGEHTTGQSGLGGYTAGGQAEGLLARRIELRSLTESIDTATPGGRLVFHIFGALAEFERAVIRERTRAGLEVAPDGSRQASGAGLCCPPVS